VDARIDIPNALASSATRRPIAPSPTIPSVLHSHAARSTGRDVDVVGARAPHGDQSQSRARANHRCRETRVCPHVDDDLCVMNPPDQFFLSIGASFGDDRHVAECAELALRRRPGEHRRKVVRNDDERPGLTGPFRLWHRGLVECLDTAAFHRTPGETAPSCSASNSTIIGGR
jgi:hypothetical protein